MSKVFQTILLQALPASGKSEVRNFLANVEPKRLEEEFHIGANLQLDDYPYVNFMREIDTALEAVHQPRIFYPSNDKPLIDGRDWATFINLLLLGYLIEFSQFTIHSIFGDPSMALRIGYIVFAIIVMCIGSALYFTANLGVSTYDAIALFLGNKKKIAPFKFVRITTDLICVALGFIMGCMPGVGTIITAFFMGPLISYFNVKIAEPMLYGKKK